MFLVNFICSNLPFKKDEKMDLLSINSLRERTYHLLEILNREVQLAEIKASIQMRAREDIDQQQREYFLQQQIKTIQDELGGSGQEQEIEEMRQKAPIYVLRCPRISASSCTPPKDIRTYFRFNADAMDFPRDVPGPLLDRMELIEVSGYITEEKIEIARKHLLPKELEANGLKKSDIKLM